VLFFGGRSEGALERIELALTIAEALELPEVLAEALNTKALLLASSGRRQEALFLLSHSLEVAEEHELGAAALRACNNLVAFMAAADRHRDELRYADRGVELARRYGNRRWEAQLQACRIWPLYNLGRWDEATEVPGPLMRRLETDPQLANELIAAAWVPTARGDLDAASAILEACGRLEKSEQEAARTAFAVLRALLLRAEGRNDEAVAILEPIVPERLTATIVAQAPDKDGFMELLDLLLDRGETERVARLLDELDRLRPGEVTPLVRAHGRRFRARLAAGRGDPDEARTGFKQAAGMFRELEMPFPLAVVLLEHGEWLTGLGEHDTAGPLLREAGEIFDSLQAQPWSERLEKARAAAPLERA
jgi:tetratricopeptide (TPR) repeat protein